jgi:antitoxin (DNA-binding transcriptional repressor) of toxin-antitoxin stability system
MKKRTRDKVSRPLYEIAAEDDVPRVAEERGVWGRPGPTVVSATEAARNFSEIISRVCYRGDTYVIEKGGKAMCEITPVEIRSCTGADLLAVLATLPRPDEEFLAAVEEVSRRQAPIGPSPWEK